MFLLPYIAYLSLGAVAGFLGGLLGIGGGLVVVPALVLLFHLLDFPSNSIMQVAIGTSLSVMVLTAAFSAWSHFKQNGIVWPLFKPLAPGMILGAISGAVLADWLPSSELKTIFGFSTICVGIYYLLFPQPNGSQMHLKYPRAPLFCLMGFFIGAISSILGIGGGLITVPLLTLFKTPIKNAISTSAATGFLIALVGALSFLTLGLTQSTEGSFGYIYFPAFICIALTSCISAFYGARAAYALSTFALKRIFGSLLVGVGLTMSLT